MKLQIIEKLDIFLKNHPLKEECEVVYFLVELRKLLDRERDQNQSEKYTLVRFHADWIVHTRKDHITVAMKEIMGKIDESIDTYPKDENIDFLLLPEFKKELASLLEEYSLPHNFCSNDEEWLNFMVALTSALADQPIINPTPNIAEFRYIDLKKEGIMANIDFRGTKTGSSITLGFGL